MEFYKGNIPIIDGDGPKHAAMLFPKDMSFGCIPRDYTVQPVTAFKAMPSTMPLIPESEYDARYDEQEAQKTSLEHLYLRGGKPAFVNLDQNGFGDCWAFSTGHSLMFNMLKRGSPITRLNPHAIAVILNQLEGGWCGLSGKAAEEIGYPADGNNPGEWPGHSRSRSNDTPALRAAMLLNRITENYVDLTRDVYDRNMTVRQSDTCLFNNQPGPRDYNWWSHSVCAIRKVRIARGDWGDLILNSWLGWGRFGLAVLRGSQAVPDGAFASLVSGVA